MLSVSFVALSLASLALASPVEQRAQTEGSVQGFEALRPLPSAETVPLLFALPASDTDGLHAALMDVSDPASPKYGQYLSKQEVEAFAAPKPESVQAVTAWLAEHNITPEVASPSGDMLRVHIPVHQANTLLKANYTQYVHMETNANIIATLSYSVPPDVEEHLSFIYPTDQFIPPAVRSPSFEVSQPISWTEADGVSVKPDAIPAHCASYTAPDCLQAVYNIPSTPASASSNNIYVPAFLNEFATKADLGLFNNQYRPDIRNATFSVVSVDKGITSGGGTYEASLDIQYTVGLATNVPTTLVSVGNSTVQGFIDLNTYLLNLTATPKVVTISYGFDEPGFPTSAANTLCNQYAQLGARGTTVLYASGDGGVAGSRFSNSCSTFIPTFPSGCPYVTSVGATTGYSPEVAAGLSAGGFSNIFPRPNYQATAATKYLTTLGSTYAGLYNQSGRGYPDVAAQGTTFAIVVNGTLVGVDGTSASSPTFASIVALVNDQRLKAGKASLGFLNPLLYSTGAASIFNDITKGSNPGCNTNGFPTKAGWDPVTGLGTVDYVRFLKAAP
ncbi:subtilisin-like protein [Cerioporus squamosus]|nr:subtilisin-like protein [Cerioporus squamosus]